MKRNKVDRSEKYTHTSMGYPYGCYKIKNVVRFFKLYNYALKEKPNLHIIEVHKKQGPIIIDIDIKQKEKERIYNIENIKNIIQVYNKYINIYIDTPCSNHKVYITEKNEPTKQNDLYKDGFHCMYPDIIISNELQYIIRNDVINEFKEKKYLEKLNLVNSYDDIFDIAVIEKNGWLLYGSKKPDRDAYSLTYIINNKLECENILNESPEQLPSLLSIRDFDDDDIIVSKLNKEKIDKLFKNLNISKPNKNKNIKRKKKYSLENIQKARQLLKILDSSRADNYTQWIELGWCLHNIDNIELLEDWIDFSSQSSKFDNGIGGGVGGECEKQWDNFKDESGLNLGSLIRWVHEDNPEEYDVWLKNQIDNYLNKAISGNSGDVAESVYHIKNNEYICASIKYSTWYQFINNRWKEIENGYTLYNYLNDTLSNLFMAKASYYSQKKYEQETSSNEFIIYEKKEDCARKVSNKLLSKGFKDEVMAELKYKFFDEKFYENLDENRDLISFDNGVYDLKNKFFRKGYGEDYISLSTHINYYPYNKNNEKIKQVEKFFLEIQPEIDMNNYVLDFFAGCLQGHTPDETFNIWTGCGSNGKSLAINLFQETMGDYATNISITLLTKSRASSNAASPELAKTKGVRFVVFQEPENDDKIHVGHMKELTGSDKISARKLYKEPVEFYPQFKTLLTCNKLPYIPSNDGGTWRRLRVIPFEIQFIDNPTEPHQRPKDPTLKENIKQWNEAFMSILIEKFKKLKTIKKEPEKITQFTKEYQVKSDIYLEFINENIVMTSNSKDYISIYAIYDIYKAWYKEGHNDKGGCVNRSELKANLEEKFGKTKIINNKQCWRSMKFPTEKINLLDD